MGTVILTLTGFLSRFIGFFYRIFLSRVFGAEGMGIYQLIAPVLALSFALTVSGIQTAISKYVAREEKTGNYCASLRYLFTGFLAAMLLSILCAIFIYRYSEEIAIGFLKEERTAPLLRIISLSIPMATVHSCINGYFYGIKKTSIPSACQLIEQVIRVGSVYLIYAYFQKQGMQPTISFAVVGLVIGEAASMCVSLIAVKVHFNKILPIRMSALLCLKSTQFLSSFKELLSLAVPLSLNRVIINFLQSIEAIFIPQQLLKYGCSTSQALSKVSFLF